MIHIPKSAFRRSQRITTQVLTVRKGRIGIAITVGVILLAIFAPEIAPRDPLQQDIANRLQDPSMQYPLGTDNYGRDILSRIIHGFRISIMVGVVSVSIGVSLGVLLGIVGGYFGGYVDDAVGRLIDIMLAFPFLLLALFIVAILGQSLTNMMIAVGIAATPRFARLARGETLSVKEQDYVKSSVSIGRPNVKIMAEHVLPNILTPIVVMGTLYMGRAIIVSAALSFLGLGVQPPTPSLGGILANGRDFMELAPWVTLFPGLAITVTVLGFNLLGDALRDVFDPQMDTGGGFT